MAYQLIMDRNAAPYEVDRALTFDAGVRNILIDVNVPDTSAPVPYFSFRPFLWFNPNVGGIGFANFFMYHDIIYRNKQAYRLNFPERWGLEMVRLNGGPQSIIRFQAYWE